MKRKNFLLSALTMLPGITIASPFIENDGAGNPGTKKAVVKNPGFENKDSCDEQQDSRTETPFVVKAGGSRFNVPMRYKGIHPNNIIISRKDTGNALSIFAYTGYAKIGPSMHLHHDQDETFYVVEGKYRFVAGTETMELGPGDTIFLPRKIAHSWIQLTDRGRLLYMAQPAGTLEDFFIEMNNLKGPLSESEAKAIHRKHGMELIGPSLTL